MDRSFRSIAEDARVSHATLSNFLHGSTPSARTLAKLERWFEGGQIGEGDREPVAPYGDPPLERRHGSATGSPAERLIHHLIHSEIVRRFVDHPAMDFVKAAFAHAVEEDFPAEEMEKFEAWRRACGARSRWALSRPGGVKLELIRPGKPVENGLAESTGNRSRDGFGASTRASA